MVPRPGIEPGRALGPRDFKSLASASSAISAKILDHHPEWIPGIFAPISRTQGKQKRQKNGNGFRMAQKDCQNNGRK